MTRGQRVVKRAPIDERINGSIVRTLEAGLRPTNVLLVKLNYWLTL